MTGTEGGADVVSRPPPRSRQPDVDEVDAVSTLVDRLVAPTIRGDRRTRVLVVIAGAVALVVAIRGQRDVLVDDAAIYFRYAARIASGDGWTYNPGDHTNGASSALYTVLLAAGRSLGVDIETTARLIGAAGYVTAAGLLSYLGARIGGLLAGALGGSFLVLSIGFQTQSLKGLEVPLAVALGLGVLAALLDEREVLAGALLGLALLNKLDAATLALAVAVAVVVVHRRVPWRLILTSASMLLPWLLVSQLRFGSPLPNSLTQKASGAVVNEAAVFSRSWLLRILEGEGFTAVTIVALGSFVVAWSLRGRRPGAAVALGASGLWGITTFAVYSSIDLGDAYPWYTTALYAPIALGAATTVAAAVGWLRRRPKLRVVALPAFAVLAVLCVVPQFSSDRGTSVATVLRGHRVNDYERFEATRRDAGIYLRDHARPGDVVETCWGWVAYEALQTVIDETCPLNTRQPVWDPVWAIRSSNPGTDPPNLQDRAPARPEIVATFSTSIGLGSRTDVVRLDPPISEKVADELCLLRIACRPAAQVPPQQPATAASTGGSDLAAVLAEDLDRPTVPGGRATSTPQPTDRGASCRAAAFVGAVGEAALAERGVTTDAVRSGRFSATPLARYVDLSPGEIHAFVDKWLPCRELDDSLVGFAMSPGIPRDRAECLVQGFTALPYYRTLLEKTMAGEIPDAFGEKEYLPLAAKCLAPS
jgi:hypothetical protein